MREVRYCVTWLEVVDAGSEVSSFRLPLPTLARSSSIVHKVEVFLKGRSLPLGLLFELTVQLGYVALLWGALVRVHVDE